MLKTYTDPASRIPHYLAVVTLLFTLYSCGGGLEIGEVKIPELNSALIRSINFNSGVATDAFIEYWPSGSDSKRKSNSSLAKVEHKIGLLGLVAETTYDYQIHLSSDEETLASEIYDFTTGMLPEHLPGFEVVVNKEDAFDGFLMLRKMDDPGTQLIINGSGKIVWYQVSDSSIFRPFSITSAPTYLALKATDEIIEMDFYGDTLLHLIQDKNGFDRNLHHEIFKDGNGYIIALTKEEKAFDLSEFGGGKAETVVGDGILVLDAEGNKIWSWNIFDADEVLRSQDLYKFRKDWSHANALSKDTDGSFLISFRNFNQIWKVDAVDGHIIWKLGENGDIDLKEDYYFKSQHAVHVNPMGSIMLFDNIAEERKTSRAIAFDIDDAGKVAEMTLVVNLPDSLYSFKQGSVFFIDADKLLFCSSMSKKIAITDLDGNILWQVNSEQSFYRAEYLGDINYF